MAAGFPLRPDISTPRSLVCSPLRSATGAESFRPAPAATSIGAFFSLGRVGVLGVHDWFRCPCIVRPCFCIFFQLFLHPAEAPPDASSLICRFLRTELTFPTVHIPRPTPRSLYGGERPNEADSRGEGARARAAMHPPGLLHARIPCAAARIARTALG